MCGNHRDLLQQLINLMQEGFEKRLKFRQEIRKRQIESMFKRVRVQLFEEHNYELGPANQLLHAQYSSLLKQFLPRTIHNRKTNNYSQIYQDLEIFEQASSNNTETLSFCVNEQFGIFGQDLISSIKKDIPITVLGELSDESQGESEDNDISVNEIKVVERCMRICHRLHLHKFSLEPVILIVKLLWNVYVNRYLLPFNNQLKEISESILQQWLGSLSKLMKSLHKKIIKDHLKQLGIETAVSAIIEYGPQLSFNSHRALLIFIDIYMANEKEQSDLVEGIVVIGNDIEHRVKYAAYCMYALKDPQMKDLCIFALSILDEIFNQFAYLIDTLEPQLYENVLRLVSHPNRDISTEALALLNTITYNSENVCEEMVFFRDNILDVIHQRLTLEEKFLPTEPYFQRSVQKCTNIISNLLLTKNRTTKEAMFSHPIWEFIYERINEQSSLFSLVIVFKYFFVCFGRTKILKILPSLLDAFVNLPLLNPEIPHILEVREMLIILKNEVFEFWDEESSEIFQAMLEQRKLMEIIEMFEN